MTVFAIIILEFLIIVGLFILGILFIKSEKGKELVSSFVNKRQRSKENEISDQNRTAETDEAFHEEKTEWEVKSLIPEDALFDETDDTFFMEDTDDTMIFEGDSDDEETMLLDAFEPARPIIHLIRSSDNERWDLKGDLFTIGSSSAKADYAVTANRKVSRNHATIFLKGEDFYIKDNSKNGTSLNGERVEADKASLLHDGDTLMLAEESFVVLIEKPGANS